MNTRERRPTGSRNDGGVTTVEVAIVAPVVLLWVLLIVQYGLWWHAQQVANAAAAEATDIAQVPDGTAEQGRAAGLSFLDQAGNLRSVVVTVDRGTEMVTAEVRGDAPQLVPALRWQVSARSEAPVQRFTPEGER